MIDFINNECESINIWILKSYFPFTYSEVFTDQYCSRHFLDDLCEKLVRNIFINEDNIVHIATERASLYEIYQNKGIDAKPITVDKKYYGIIPFDTSLIDNSLWVKK